MAVFFELISDNRQKISIKDFCERMDDRLKCVSKRVV